MRHCTTVCALYQRTHRVRCVEGEMVHSCKGCGGPLINKFTADYYQPLSLSLPLILTHSCCQCQFTLSYTYTNSAEYLFRPSHSIRSKIIHVKQLISTTISNVLHHHSSNTYTRIHENYSVVVSFDKRVDDRRVHKILRRRRRRRQRLTQYTKKNCNAII